MMFPCRGDITDDAGSSLPATEMTTVERFISSDHLS